MKPDQYRGSLKITIFFVYLRKKLLSKNLKIDELFTKQIYLRKPNQIQKIQFAKIVAYSGAVLTTMQTYDVFNQLKYGTTIPINTFILAYHQLTDKIPIQQKIVQPSKNISIENKQVQNKIIKNAYLRLQKFVRQNSGIQLFDQCDQNGDGYLTKKQFNQYLIVTDLKQFDSKEIRNMVSKQIFSYYPNGKISRNDFVKLFKIDLEQEKNKKAFKNNNIISAQIKISQPQIKPLIKPQVPKQNIKEKPFQKLSGPKISQDPVVPSKALNQKIIKKQSEQNSLSEAFDVREIFPASYRFYRLGIPHPEQLQYFQTLEGLLQSHQIFNDKSNPKTHLGSYKYANQIFNQEKYEIFIMAASVIQRQKSRIGLARQIQPKDVMQGQLGDCYLLSSIASIISFYPQIIFDKILFSVNEAHFYVVKLFIDGEWQFITMDDQFPCEYGKPVFAKPHGRQIWVMLLQKCWAKVFGSYQVIQSGTPTEGFRALTGAPAEYILVQSAQDQKSILNKLEQAFQKRYVATISGSKYLTSLSEAQKQKIGLVSDHAYSFLKLLKINGQLIVKMRNPWGKTVWNGDWSFQSKKWTKQLRQKYNYTYKPNDGSFYISWQHLLNYFNSFVIAKIDPTNTHTSLKLKPKSHKSIYLRIVILQQGNYNFSVYQESKRKNREIKNYQYIGIRMVVVKDNNGQYQYINSINKQNSHCTTFQQFYKKGVYIVAIKAEWNQKMYPLVFNVYGAQKVQIQQIDNTIAPIFKKQVIQSYSKKYKGKIKYYTRINLPQAYNQIQISIQRGIGYLRIKNPTNKSFTSILSMPKIEGLKIIKPYQLPFNFIMNSDSQYIVGFWVSSKGYSYQSSQSITY